MGHNKKSGSHKLGNFRSGAGKVARKLSQQLASARRHVQSGDLVQAAEVYKDLARDNPNCGVCYFELGGVYWRQGRLKEAEDAYRNALKLSPENAGIYCNLAIVVWKRSGMDKAVQYFHNAIRLNPRNTTVMYNFAGMLLQDGCCEKAVRWFDEVLEIDPGHAEAWMYKGNACFEMGEYKNAMACYTRHAELRPSGGAEIRLAAAIPMIPDSVEHITAIRLGFMDRLQKLIDSKISVSDPVCENGYTNFFLAYHGQDDLPLQRKYAELFEQACPSLMYVAAHCSGVVPGKRNAKIRVGFISKYFRGHSIGKSSYGIMEQLNREEFELVAIFLGEPSDQTGYAIAAVADEILALPNDLDSARRLVEARRLDILFYQDIGMDPFTYFLSFSRLAPVQCTSFGHPVTTGIKNIDYYISTELWEPEEADSHYSETLIRLKSVASVAYYYKPKQPKKSGSRTFFDLPEKCHLYICPQTLFKFHPDFDHILAEILRADEEGLVILIEGKHRSWAQILKRRFKSSIPDVAGRIRFVDRQSGENYAGLLQIADVMLDTIHFCGFNTSLEGFAAGLPVVTLPGQYMRSRHTAAFYRRMDYMECIADDEKQYVELAVRLGKDETYRAHVVGEIRNRMQVLWEEELVVREFEKFFKSAHNKAAAAT